MQTFIDNDKHCVKIIQNCQQLVSILTYNFHFKIRKLIHFFNKYIKDNILFNTTLWI